MNTCINTLKNRFTRACARCYTGLRDARRKLREDSGQFVMDHAIVFVIAIVLGGIALTLLVNYLQSDLSNTLKTKINEFFN